MYEVKSTGQKFASFSKAIEHAKAANSEIYEIETGLRRWAPIPKVSKKKLAYYEHRKAAYEAYVAAQ